MAVEIVPKVKRATVKFTTHTREYVSNAFLTGEWDGWTAIEMKKKMDGTFSVTINLDLGKSYQFGYLMDGNWAPDTDLPLTASPFGTDNSILDLTKTAAATKSAPKRKTTVKRKTAVKRKPGIRYKKLG